MVAEAKIAALQSDLDAKEDERKLYYDKFTQYGRENRELKRELAEIEIKRTGKAKVISQTSKQTETASTSQAAPVASSVPTKPKEPKTIDPTDVPSANPPLSSNGQNATVVNTSQQNTEATNVPLVVSMVFL